MVDVALCHIWRSSGVDDENGKQNCGNTRNSVREGGDVVVVDDDDDDVIIIKQMVMLVQAFAGFLLCYVIGQYPYTPFQLKVFSIEPFS